MIRGPSSRPDISRGIRHRRPARRGRQPRGPEGLHRSRGNWWQDEGFWTRGKQASCLEIEGPRTSPKTGAPNDREGHQSVTPATDRGPLPSQGQAMTIRRLSPKTQYQYIRHVKKFADFLGRSADKATTEDVHRYQLWLASIGTSVGTANVSATAL